MNRSNLLPQIIGVTLAMLFLVGCGITTTLPASTQVASAVTDTVADTPKPTVTLTLAQLSTGTQPAIPRATETQLPEADPVVVLQGKFEGVGREHSGTGTATVYKKSDGSYLLSFENFAVCCGPDLYVFLAKKSFSGNVGPGDYIELSSLKDITGNQEYVFSADTDLSQIKSVVIYCKPYQVVIATATLK